MAERIPPIEVKVESKFDAKGIKAAKKEIKKFSSTVESDLSQSEQKFEDIKKAWGDFSSSLGKRQNKVKKSMDAVAASFERVEKANSKLKDATAAREKAELAYKKRQLALERKKNELSKLSEDGAGTTASKNAEKEIKKLYSDRQKAIKAAKDNENKYLNKLNEKRDRENKAKLTVGDATRKAAKLVGEMAILKTSKDKAEIALNEAGIRKVRGQDNKVRYLDLNTGELLQGNKLVKNLIEAEDKYKHKVLEVSDALAAQKNASKALVMAQNERELAENQYKSAKEATSAVENNSIENDVNALRQDARNNTLETQKKLVEDVALAESELANANTELGSATRRVTEATDNYNKEVAESVKVTKQETNSITKQTGAMSKFKSAGNAIASVTDRIKHKLRSLNFSNLIAKFYTVYRIAGFLNTFVEASSEWIENLNLLEVVYNDTATAADEVKEKISDLSETFRMDINALAQYVSVFKQMANAMGQTAEVGSQMAEVLSLIALDVSSLRNVDVQTVVSDFTGALAGQVKPVRKYGFDITMYSIDELMKELGYGAISRSMTQANKQLARAVLLVRQSKDAWGDLAKTINTYANQQRVLNDQFTQFKRLLGNVVMGTFQVGDSFEEAKETAGIMQKGIWYLNGAMIAVNTVLDAIVPKVESFNGAIAAGSEEVTSALEEEEEAVNSTLASFDKFNSLEDGSGGVASSVSEDLERLLGQETQSYMAQFQERLKNINMYAEDIAETILGIMFPEYSSWKGGDENKTFAKWAEQSGTLSDKTEDIKNNILSIGQTLAFLISPLMGIMTVLVRQIAETKNVDERVEKIKEMVELAEGLYNILSIISPAILNIATAFLPLITVLSKFIALVSESPAAIWFLVSAVAALAVAIAALKIAAQFDLTFKKALKITGFAIAITGAVAGTAAAIAAIDKNFFADGGFQAGGLFYAGEAGPEWVGRQGSTSTIINDGQMSDIMRDSVAKGVMQANIASRQISGAGRSGKVAVVNLNGKHLFDVVEQEGYKEGKVFAKSR